MEHDPVLGFAALAHPHRLQVMRLLMRHYPRRIPAGEIGAVLALRPSTLSGYLAQLMEAGLITQERRATSLLYAASVEGVSLLNAAWMGDVCGGRGWPETGSPGARVRNLLFIGVGNTGPSLIAEALLRRHAGEAFEVFSAGIESVDEPAPEVMTFLAQGDHDTGLLWSKPLGTWQGEGAPQMDIVVTLGDRAAALAPDWPGGPHRAAWRLAPALSLDALQLDLSARLSPLVAMDLAVTPAARVQRVLDEAAEPVIG
ncbi:helix-turn-helix domain-containing protein [Pararhodobacter zhoushanensis]|uniref:arsenate reductase/protein-tyrosine-phosphatase family protein n=1 Tax=Pararhodobacter zhoushanensis TaxID=2479545 RepID=UPI0013E0E253|nr:helix-turn-helix domain-containing protein [Pararhodobacter zhoushanensis]